MHKPQEDAMKLLDAIAKIMDEEPGYLTRGKIMHLTIDALNHAYGVGFIDGNIDPIRKDIGR